MGLMVQRSRTIEALLPGVNNKLIVYRSDEDNGFVAEVPELAGCMIHRAAQHFSFRKCG